MIRSICLDQYAERGHMMMENFEEEQKIISPPLAFGFCSVFFWGCPY